jgi:hypothetical protein
MLMHINFYVIFVIKLVIIVSFVKLFVTFHFVVVALRKLCISQPCLSSLVAEINNKSGLV